MICSPQSVKPAPELQAWLRLPLKWHCSPGSHVPSPTLFPSFAFPSNVLIHRNCSYVFIAEWGLWGKNKLAIPLKSNFEDLPFTLQKYLSITMEYHEYLSGAGSAY